MIAIKHLANSITGSRIIASFLLLFYEPFGTKSFILYTFCGLTDMIDGSVARKTHSDSKHGAFLDSFADILFLMAALIKLLPVLLESIPSWSIYAAILITVIKMLAYIIGAVRFSRFIALHTIMNKVTGVSLFCIPYLLMLIDINIVLSIVSVLAGIAAIEELLCQIRMKDNSPDIRTFFELSSKGEIIYGENIVLSK